MDAEIKEHIMEHIYAKFGDNVILGPSYNPIIFVDTEGNSYKVEIYRINNQRYLEIRTLEGELIYNKYIPNKATLFGMIDEAFNQFGPPPSFIY